MYTNAIGNIKPSKRPFSSVLLSLFQDRGANIGNQPQQIEATGLSVAISFEGRSDENISIFPTRKEC